MREAFGDGYVEALRHAYPEVPESADYVMYWWHKSAQMVESGGTVRAGLITTNTITQTQNRAVVQNAIAAGVSPAWAVRDHPWVDEAGSAAVRVAITVLEKRPEHSVLATVDAAGRLVEETRVTRLHADLRADVDVVGAADVPLSSNRGLAAFGFALHGRGFVLDADEASRYQYPDVVRPYLAGRDLTKRPRKLFVIDFGLMTEEEARGYPELFDLVRSRVKPHRDANARAALAKFWWRFGWPRPELRSALQGLERYIATTETSKHRIFTFLDAQFAPDHSLICIASDDAFVLGVLSSRVHEIWALAAGGTLEDRPRYNKTVTFDPFPFPEANERLRSKIGSVSETIDAHRTAALSRSDSITNTALYNVLNKLRAGEPLTEKERDVHDTGACGVLLDLHEELDRLVALAYGWSPSLDANELLSNLVALHDARVVEERGGHVRWLRPSYQLDRFGQEIRAGDDQTLLIDAGADRVGKAAWPTRVSDQIRVLQDFVHQAPVTAEEATSSFQNARLAHVLRHLETLELLGEARRDANGAFHAVSRTAA